MNKLNLFGVLIETDNQSLNEIWSDVTTLEIYIASNLLVGDIIDYKTHISANDLMKDFDTTRFIIVKRELLFNTDSSDPEKNRNSITLYIKPVY